MRPDLSYMADGKLGMARQRQAQASQGAVKRLRPYMQVVRKVECADGRTPLACVAVHRIVPFRRSMDIVHIGVRRANA